MKVFSFDADLWARWYEKDKEKTPTGGHYDGINRDLYLDGRGKLPMIYDHEKQSLQSKQAQANAGASMQKFDTGATRSADEHKHDFEGFLSPTALEAYGDYMTRHRYQRNGTVRSSDNWQKGIPMHKYMASLVRHVFDLWRAWRGTTVYDKDSPLHDAPMTMLDICSAILFNVQGLMHEIIKRHGERAQVVCDQTREAIKEGREFSFYDCKVGAIEGGLRGRGSDPARNAGPYYNIEGGLYRGR